MYYLSYIPRDITYRDKSYLPSIHVLHFHQNPLSEIDCITKIEISFFFILQIGRSATKKYLSATNRTSRAFNSSSLISLNVPSLVISLYLLGVSYNRLNPAGTESLIVYNSAAPAQPLRRS